MIILICLIVSVILNIIFISIWYGERLYGQGLEKMLDVATGVSKEK